MNRRRQLSWSPRELAWWVAVLFMVGATLFALGSMPAYSTLVPGTVLGITFVLGAAFFTAAAASHLAWREVAGGRIWCVNRDDADWWVAALNYLGSAFFFLAAVASFTLPTTGEVLNITIVNIGTFAGALCFFAGAYLLLPVRSR